MLPRSGADGFTLVEMLTVCTLVALLAMVAWPSLQNHRLRGGRLDAVSALTRLQVAQEQHRNVHGLYAAELPALGLRSPVSPQGLYTLSITPRDGNAYIATATARGAQAQDRACPALTLEVDAGYPSEGPDPGCWAR